MKNIQRSNDKNHAIDLLYPNYESKNYLKKRRNDLSALPQDYIKNLELDKLAAILSSYNIDSSVNIFAQLCDDEEVINYRLDILEDFLNIPTLASTVKNVIDVILENDRRSIYNLSEPDSFDKLSAAIDAFDGYVKALEIMHGFIGKKRGEVKSIGISNMLDFFESQYNDKNFVSLRKDLEELKQSLKNGIKSVTVAINLDERMMPVSAGIIDRSDRPFILKPSLFDRILYHDASFSPDKLLKSMKTKYISSEVTKEKIINTTDQALFEELGFVTDKYIDMIDDVLSKYQKLELDNLFSISYQLEFYMGAVKLIDLCKSVGLEMCRPKILPKQERRACIEGVFDPIYFSESRKHNLKSKDKKGVVINDIAFDDNARFHILTGANNGGKTTFVRAIGICQIMAQTGLYVAASRCEISLCDFIYTHFPKEEQTGIDASRFTSEIKEFKTISETITPYSVLLMNESIQSTTPRECVEIARELVEIFCTVGVRGIFATHLVDLAEAADEINKKENISSKLSSLVALADVGTGQRLYKIVQGKPQKNSLAKSILEKYGIDSATIAKRFGTLQ